jgi:hypothetical protein
LSEGRPTSAFGTSAPAFAGATTAPRLPGRADAETAIQVAIEKYNITDPEKQKRLVAQRRR